MARNRTPTAVLELRGSFKKNPQRSRSDEPKPNGVIGDPPDTFDENLAAIWYELVSQTPANVLTRADRWAVEVACRLMQTLRTGNYKASEVNALLSFLARMGLTPADRARIAIPKEKEETDELGQLAAEGRAIRPN